MVYAPDGGGGPDRGACSVAWTRIWWLSSAAAQAAGRRIDRAAVTERFAGDMRSWADTGVVPGAGPDRPVRRSRDGGRAAAGSGAREAGRPRHRRPAELPQGRPGAARARRAGQVRQVLVHTGQHYDDRLMPRSSSPSSTCPSRISTWGSGSGRTRAQTAAVMTGLEELFARASGPTWSWSTATSTPPWPPRWSRPSC